MIGETGTDVGGTAPASSAADPGASTVGERVVAAPGGVLVTPGVDRKAAILADVQNRFTYHPPKGDQAQRYSGIRDRFRELAEKIVLETPVSREQATALTLLDQAMMMANAAIARNEP